MIEKNTASTTKCVKNNCQLKAECLKTLQGLHTKTGQDFYRSCRCTSLITIFANWTFLCATGCWMRLFRHKYSGSNTEYICTTASLCLYRAPALGCSCSYWLNTVFNISGLCFTAGPIFLRDTDLNKTRMRFLGLYKRNFGIATSNCTVYRHLQGLHLHVMHQKRLGILGTRIAYKMSSGQPLGWEKNCLRSSVRTESNIELGALFTVKKRCLGTWDSDPETLLGRRILWKIRDQGSGLWPCHVTWWLGL